MITNQEICMLNEQYVRSVEQEQKLASVVSLAQLVQSTDLAAMFKQHQNSGWQVPIVRALARAYSIV